MCEQDYFTNELNADTLLMLGLPAKSADCYRDDEKRLHVRSQEEMYDDEFFAKTGYKPCWSMGRLIDIYERCTGRTFVRTRMPEGETAFFCVDVFMQVHYAMIHRTVPVFDLTKLDE